MSAASTPNRHPRGVHIPGIDTQASKQDAAMALQYGGWLTPPQSAHDSRRPSLAYPSYSEMPYTAGSTATSFSLPPTPVHGSTDRLQHFHYPLSHDHTLTAGLPAHFGSDHLAGDMARTGLEEQQRCSDNQGIAWHGNEFPTQNIDAFGIHPPPEHHVAMWHEPQLNEQNFLRQPGSIQPTLFSTGHGMASDQHSVAATYAGSCRTVVASMPSLPGLQYDHPESGYYANSVLVEPSQISPGDTFGIQPYSCLSSPGDSPQGLTGSFDSVANSFDSYDAMEPPSPDGGYYTEQEDAILIKNEALASPTPYSQSKLPSRRGMSACQNLPIRTRHKVRKQRRKTHVVQTRTDRVGDIDFTLEGDNLHFDQHDRVVWSIGSLPTKQHKCPHVEENGTRCNGAFDRMEHLKRHMGKHSTDRKFPCPLDKCDKKIARSDNACDHFRTHLKTEPRNRRNLLHHWDIVKDRILVSYDEKAAGKIVTNLQRWLENSSVDIQKYHNFGRFRYKL